MSKKFIDMSLQLLPLVLLVLVLVAVLLVGHQGTAATAGDPVAAAVQAMLSLSGSGKFLYRTSEAKAALGCGTTKLYGLINSNVLDTRRFGGRTYITAASLEAFIASLPPDKAPAQPLQRPARTPATGPADYPFR